MEISQHINNVDDVKYCADATKLKILALAQVSGEKNLNKNDEIDLRAALRKNKNWNIADNSLFWQHSGKSKIKEIFTRAIEKIIIEGEKMKLRIIEE